MRERVTDWLTLRVFLVAWRCVRLLPASVAYGLFDRAAVAAYGRGGRSVQRLRANYARVRPELGEAELEHLVREGMRSYLRYWCDAFRLPDMTQEVLETSVRVVGDGPARESLGGGRGAVAFLGHMGNWDLAGAWSTHHLAPVTTVAERLRPEGLYDAFVGFRERLGMTVLPLTGADPAFPQLVRAVRRGGLVPLLADRDLTDQGVTVTFCDRPARMAPGPAALAAATGAPLLPVSVHYEPHHGPGGTGSGHDIVITFHPAVPVPTSGRARERAVAMTQGCAIVLEAAVREHTQDWHMMQRVFAEDLS
ncbi:phosphatidylinositol mannoside acyltransferase [Arsenicicoccus sp. oral taxon 190]|uniref:phosphatidylinositol mannoside acyltransferase n=1 Tax=Arsenicicoccus sp. oral taxon 190 TaxID=1658671 RepID=UPI000679EBDE|nr:phosphatidylinositol mannoside acyltransferase [Arsenicicoccus sp. oral taxon 190]AKT51800.1 lipid A biosynthesis acyltransferase [Arsenicicoccus sp. oral taxon 190]